uniref:Uncharacterized protein n=1 Tax=Clastoptera arizonana TaxID=38151 RepID=A0A1B6DR40_9HEMI
MGFRANWDVQPASLLPPRHRQDGVHQRALHDTIRGVLDWHQLNGNACLMRAICESSGYHGNDIITRAFSLIFNKTEDLSCPQEIDCPWSLIEVVDDILR